METVLGKDTHQEHLPNVRCCYDSTSDQNKEKERFLTTPQVLNSRYRFDVTITT